MMWRPKGDPGDQAAPPAQDQGQPAAPMWASPASDDVALGSQPLNSARAGGAMLTPVADITMLGPNGERILSKPAPSTGRPWEHQVIPQHMPGSSITPPAERQPQWASASGDTVTYTRGDGSTYAQSEHKAHPNRDNDPDDLENGKTSNRHGQIGADGMFPIFASPQDGYDAAFDRMEQIAATSSSQHGQSPGSLANITYVWSPPEHNNTEKIIGDVTRATGLRRDEQWSSLTRDQKLAWLHAYARHAEGFKGG